MKRLVAQSFCGWPYARIGGPVKSEDDPLDPDPPKEFRRTLDAILLSGRRLLGRNHLGEGFARRRVLRRGTGVFDGPMVDELRRRRVPLIGKAAGWWSFLHVDDAARATAVAVEHNCKGDLQISSMTIRPGQHVVAGFGADAHRKASLSSRWSGLLA